MTDTTFKRIAAGLAVAGTLGFAGPVFAGEGCWGKEHATKTTTTADADQSADQTKSTVLTKTTKTTAADG